MKRDSKSLPISEFSDYYCSQFQSWTLTGNICKKTNQKRSKNKRVTPPTFSLYPLPSPDTLYPLPIPPTFSLKLLLSP